MRRVRRASVAVTRRCRAFAIVCGERAVKPAIAVRGFSGRLIAFARAAIASTPSRSGTRCSLRKAMTRHELSRSARSIRPHSSGDPSLLEVATSSDTRLK
jgi:hypothetical protein